MQTILLIGGEKMAKNKNEKKPKKAKVKAIPTSEMD